MLKLIAPLAALALLAAVGCAEQPKKVASQQSGGVLDIAPTPPATNAYTQTQVVAQPVTIEPAAAAAPSDTVTYASAGPASPAGTVTPAPAGGTGAAPGGTYKVRKGDTLFAIAKATYGDGRQWKRIASANPGVSPTTLKAGQTITLP